jgi:hypothetical protein
MVFSKRYGYEPVSPEITVLEPDAAAMTLRHAGALALAAGMLILVAARPALCWTLEVRVSDAEGNEIPKTEGGWISIVGSIPQGPAPGTPMNFANGVGPGPAQSEFTFENLPDSATGCAIKMSVERDPLRAHTCFKGGTVKLDACGGPGREHLMMKWTAYGDRSPDVTMHWSDGQASEIAATAITSNPITVHGFVTAREGATERPVKGVEIRILDGNNAWRTVAEKTTDARGEYDLSILPSQIECPEYPRLKMVLDTGGTGYVGGETGAGGATAHWMLSKNCPPDLAYEGVNFGPGVFIHPACVAKASR